MYLPSSPIKLLKNGKSLSSIFRSNFIFFSIAKKSMVSKDLYIVWVRSKGLLFRSKVIFSVLARSIISFIKFISIFELYLHLLSYVIDSFRLFLLFIKLSVRIFLYPSNYWFSGLSVYVDILYFNLILEIKLLKILS